MSCALLSESTRPAAWTAWTSVDSAGLALAAVATGAVLMPAKLPGPSVGTAEQPGPNGWPDAGIALLWAADELAELPVSADAVLSDDVLEPQALSVTANAETAVRSAARGRRGLFTGGGPWGAVRQHCRWRGGAPDRRSGPVACRRPGRDMSVLRQRKPGKGSGGRHADRVPAARAVREGVCPGAGLHFAVRARGPDGDLVRTRPEVVRQQPLAPHAGLVLRRELGRRPVPAVDLDLDLRDAAGLRPGPPRDGTAAGAEGPHRSRGVDAGLDLDRTLDGPAAGHPVGVEGVERGGLDAGEPFARRDVAVEPGDQHPDRKSVLDRQGLAVHAEREHRVLHLEGRPGGCTDRHAVGGPADQL